MITVVSGYESWKCHAKKRNKQENHLHKTDGLLSDAGFYWKEIGLCITKFMQYSIVFKVHVRMINYYRTQQPSSSWII